MGKLVLKSRHRVLCGDSTNPEHVKRLMGGARADLCFTSPPYAQQREYTADSRDKIAAEQAGSRCFAMEIAPIYCDIAVKRFEKFTGERAVLWAP